MNIEQVPVIDVSEPDSPEALRAIDSACREWGFFQVTGHGVDGELQTALMEAMKSFFHQPDRTKQAISRTAENPWGFYDRELTKNIVDWKQIYDYGPAGEGEMRPQWPDLPEFRETLLAYYSACEKLAFRLLSAISLNLGMPADYLAGGFLPEHTSYLRLNYYPVCPTPARPPGLVTPQEGHLGINHHTDAGALTLLLQDNQPGLEVYHRGTWHQVRPHRDALVINIGDIVQVWSNDRYRAALHRVTVSDRAERYTAPFFFNPAYETSYAPLPTTVDRQHPARYRPINWGEFRARRAEGDYADYGDEVQIIDYAIQGN